MLAGSDQNLKREVSFGQSKEFVWAQEFSELCTHSTCLLCQYINKNVNNINSFGEWFIESLYIYFKVEYRSDWQGISLFVQT